MAESHDAAAASPRSSASGWWSVLLVASLALNLLVAGALAVRFFAPERFERYVGAGYSPLIPRRFMSDLPSDRRHVIGDLLRKNRAAFHEDFGQMRKFAGDLADALDHQPYDEAAVMAAIQGHAKVVDGMIDRGAAVTIEAIRNLTPDERTLLARRIRERASGRK